MSVWSAFKSIRVKAFVKPRADSLVFQLHYRWTCLLLLACASLTTLYDFIGAKIDCSLYKGAIETDLINTYCYIMGTYTVDHLHNGQVGKPTGPAFPGVGPHNPEEDDVTYHKFYQWVPFVLVIQAATFYLPHLLWKREENSLFKSIIQDMNWKDYLSASKDGTHIGNYFNRHKEFEALATYMVDQYDSYAGWAFKFIGCEVLSLLVTLLNMFITNLFLGGAFLEYGVKVFAMSDMNPENRTDAMQEVFPRMAKCSFNVFGPSGSVESRDIMCLLPTNIANEKIYLMLWFWFLILATLGMLWLIVRAVTFVKPVRDFMFMLQFCTMANKTPGLRVASRGQVKAVLDDFDFNNYLLLCQLAANMESSVFREFLNYLARNKIQKIGTEREGEDSDTIPMTAVGASRTQPLYPNAPLFDMGDVVVSAMAANAPPSEHQE